MQAVKRVRKVCKKEVRTEQHKTCIYRQRWTWEDRKKVKEVLNCSRTSATKAVVQIRYFEVNEKVKRNIWKIEGTSLMTLQDRPRKKQGFSRADAGRPGWSRWHNIRCPQSIFLPPSTKMLQDWVVWQDLGSDRTELPDCLWQRRQRTVGEVTLFASQKNYVMFKYSEDL